MENHLHMGINKSHAFGDLRNGWSRESKGGRLSCSRRQERELWSSHYLCCSILCHGFLQASFWLVLWCWKGGDKVFVTSGASEKRFLSFIPWKRVCSSKVCSGLRLRRSEDVNQPVKVIYWEKPSLLSIC